MPAKKLFRNPPESYSVVLTIVIYFYALYYHFVFPFPKMVIACLVAGALMLLTIPLERIVRKPAFSSNYMISVGYLLTAFSAALLDGLYGTRILYVSLAPLLAGFSQTRYVLFWCIAALALFFGIHYGDVYGLINPYRLSPEFRHQFALTDAIGITLIIASITTIFVKARKRQFEDIQKKHAQIETLVRVIAHDIANPLNLISFSLSKAAKHGLDEDLENRMKKGINSIQAIIQQTRDIQALDAGKITVNLQNDVCLRNLIQQSIEVFEEQLAKKHIQVCYDSIHPELRVIVDPQIFQSQILNNLLSNAIKFSHEHGKIEFKVQSNSALPTQKVELMIIDHGIGIPKETLDSLFKSTKLHSQMGTNGEPGTGFGLTIVKKYLEQMNASIDVQSVAASDNNNSESGTSIRLSLRKPCCK